MRISKLVTGLSTVFVIYFILHNQKLIFGREYVAASEFQTVLLLTLIAVYAVISSLERLSHFRLMLLPFILITLLDILFASLMFFGYPQYYVLYQTLRLPLAVFVGALAFSYIPLTENQLYQSLISASSLVVAAIFSYILFSTLSSALDIPSVAIPSLVLFLIFAATALVNAFEGEVFEWIRSERSFLILILIILTVYSIIIKPYLSDRPGIANFFEWAVVAFTVIKVTRDLRGGIEVDEREFVAAHKLQDRFLKDRLFSEIEFAERAFIEGGSKALLLITIIKALASAEVESHRIASLIVPLVNYIDEKPPKLAFPWEKKLIESRNRKRRLSIVEQIKKELVKLKI
ncbi:hypothetical protein [Archaeoglobus neptunius]|uniref:hypothetical protein n=1 Tax=Archaeoglobus neptunius TaxID=2798580 RepID=UPI001925AFE5|nr:hypothetical protein [Archaeoglobus neptunius]